MFILIFCLSRSFPFKENNLSGNDNTVRHKTDITGIKRRKEEVKLLLMGYMIVYNLKTNKSIENL